MTPELAPGIEKVLFTEEQIEQRISEVAAEISERCGLLRPGVYGCGSDSGVHRSALPPESG